MQGSVIGLDISKQVFQLHGVSAEGKVALRKRLRRAQADPNLPGRIHPGHLKTLLGASEADPYCLHNVIPLRGV